MAAKIAQTSWQTLVWIPLTALAFCIFATVATVSLYRDSLDIKSASSIADGVVVSKDVYVRSKDSNTLTRQYELSIRYSDAAGTTYYLAAPRSCVENQRFQIRYIRARPKSAVIVGNEGTYFNQALIALGFAVAMGVACLFSIRFVVDTRQAQERLKAHGTKITATIIGVNQSKESHKGGRSRKSSRHSSNSYTLVAEAQNN